MQRFLNFLWMCISWDTSGTWRPAGAPLAAPLPFRRHEAGRRAMGVLQQARPGTSGGADLHCDSDKGRQRRVWEWFLQRWRSHRCICGWEYPPLYPNPRTACQEVPALEPYNFTLVYIERNISDCLRNIECVRTLAKLNYFFPIIFRPLRGILKIDLYPNFSRLHPLHERRFSKQVKLEYLPPLQTAHTMTHQKGIQTFPGRLWKKLSPCNNSSFSGLYYHWDLNSMQFVSYFLQKMYLALPERESIV